MNIELLKKRYFLLCETLYNKHGYSKDICESNNKFSYIDTAGLCYIDSQLFSYDEQSTPIRIYLSAEGDLEKPRFYLTIHYFSSDNYLTKEKYWYLTNLLCRYFIIMDNKNNTALNDEKNDSFSHEIVFQILDII